MSRKTLHDFYFANLDCSVFEPSLHSANDHDQGEREAKVRELTPHQEPRPPDETRTADDQSKSPSHHPRPPDGLSELVDQPSRTSGQRRTSLVQLRTIHQLRPPDQTYRSTQGTETETSQCKSPDQQTRPPDWQVRMSEDQSPATPAQLTRPSRLRSHFFTTLLDTLKVQVIPRKKPP